MREFFINLHLTKSLVFLDTIMSEVILDGCEQFISCYLNLNELSKVNTIFAIFHPANSHQILLIITHKANEHYLLNPTTLI